MRLAIKEARKNLKRIPSGGPFGACIVRKGRVIAASRNTVYDNDATCHAEMNAIRAASKKLGTFDLAGCIIYSTTEPCPMCFSATHWANIDAVIYGTSISDAKKLGFNELTIPARAMKMLGGSRVAIVPGFLKAECRDLLADWGLKNSQFVY